MSETGSVPVGGETSTSGLPMRQTLRVGGCRLGVEMGATQWGWERNRERGELRREGEN